MRTPDDREGLPGGREERAGGREERAGGRDQRAGRRERLAAAASALLALDGTAFVLRPWQAGYLVSLSEGRDPGPVPLACGLGARWLQDRLDEAMAAVPPAPTQSSPPAADTGDDRSGASRPSS